MLIRPRLSVIALGVAAVAAVVGLIACEQTRRPIEPERAWAVSARNLHNSYVDGSDRYTNRTVQVALPEFSYLLADGTIQWHGGDPKMAPDIMFFCQKLPPDASRAIVVEGVCRGRVEYRPPHPFGPRFHVRVEGATWTPHH